MPDSNWVGCDGITLAASCRSYIRARNSRFSLGRPPRTAASTSSAGSSGWPRGHGRPDQLGAGRLTASVNRMCFGADRLGTSRPGGRDLRPAGQGAEVLVDPPPGLRRLKVARDAEDRVVRGVVGPEERRHVGQPGGREVGHRADDAVVVGMALGIERLPHRLLGLAVRDVVDRLPALVLDHVSLFVELLLRHRRQQEAHPIGLEPEGPLQRVAGHALVIVGPVVVGRARCSRRRASPAAAKKSSSWCFEPRNIMCSKRWAKPVRPGFSSLEPTLY